MRPVHQRDQWSKPPCRRLEHWRTHSAQIIRKLKDGMALQFTPLTREARQNFQKVIDDYNTREFAGSHA